MRRRMQRTHLPFDQLAPLGFERREPAATHLPTVRPADRRPVPDARTERHRFRALLHDAERGGDPDELVA